LVLLEARLALRGRDLVRAERALVRLVEAGTADGPVFLWAGQLAERRGDTAQAEARYQQAGDLRGPSARLARIHLARLLHRLGRAARAQELLRIHLAEHPDDSHVRALLAVLGEPAR
jgi:predicted Zn-dependent protease